MSLQCIWFLEWFGPGQPESPALPAPEAESVLAACLAKARQRFFEPSDLPYIGIFLAADVTAGKLTPQECMSLLIETRDDIRARVSEQAYRFRPHDTSVAALTHSLQCLASLVLEYHLREDAELVEIEEARRSKIDWSALFPDCDDAMPAAASDKDRPAS